MARCRQGRPRRNRPQSCTMAAAGGAEHRRWRCWGANQTGERVRINSGSRPELGVRESQGPGGTFSLLSSGRRARRFERLMLYSEAEFAFLFGRELLPRERRALREATELARQVAQKRESWRGGLPVDIIEAAFGQPTPREMLQRHGHPAMWAMRFVAEDATPKRRGLIRWPGW